MPPQDSANLGLGLQGLLVNPTLIVGGRCHNDRQRLVTLYSCQQVFQCAFYYVNLRDRLTLRILTLWCLT